MKLKVSPGILVILFGALMWSFDWYLFPGFFHHPLFYWVSRVFLVLGVLFGLSALFQFHKHSTSVNPHNLQKASTLVQSGIYRISRNPMYTGLMFLLIGLGFRLENLLALLFIPLFVMYMNRFQIMPEEEILFEKFGNEYQEYKWKVRRWI